MNGFEFRRTRFISCDISETDMRDNDMRFVQFNTCNLQGSLFNNSILNNTDITRCNITDANFFGVYDNFIYDLEQRSDLNNTGHFIREPILEEDEDEDEEDEDEEYGIAFEIHNAFHKLDQSKLIEFINSARETKPFTLLPIDNNSMRFSTTLNSVLTDEIHLVFSTDLDTRSRLLTRLPILIGQIEDIPFTRDILALAILTISFAKSISTEFYKTYITLFIDDSFEAYGNRGSIDASCPKGIIERIVFSLYTASIVECPDITSIEVCQEPYKSLIKIIGPAMPVHLDFNGLTKEWFENFSHKVTGKTEEERVKNRKNSYIEFMSSKLKILVSNTPENNDRIAKDADNFETAGLFSDDNISDYQEAGMIILPLRYF
jgi:hypothetical protein